MSAIENTRMLIDREAVGAITELVAAETTGVILTAYQFQWPTDRTSTAHADLIDAMKHAPQQARLCRILMAAPSRNTPATTANSLTANALRAAGWQVRISPANPLLHSKVWVFGEHTAIIGSHNMTSAAMTKNREASVITDAPRIISRLHRYFADMWIDGKDLQ